MPSIHGAFCPPARPGTPRLPQLLSAHRYILPACWDVFSEGNKIRGNARCGKRRHGKEVYAGKEIFHRIIFLPKVFHNVACDAPILSYLQARNLHRLHFAATGLYTFRVKDEVLEELAEVAALYRRRFMVADAGFSHIVGIFSFI